MIGINDGGGARLQEGVVSLHAYGGIFFRNVQASGVIPQISVILGSCAGGAVYSPAMTDFIFMVQGISNMFITGPDVVKTVTGEEVTLEELGGAMSHATKSGVATFVAPDEKACLDDVRYLLSFLPSNNLEDPPAVVSGDDPERETPELVELIPASPNQPYDMTKVIAGDRRRRRVLRGPPALGHVDHLRLRPHRRPGGGHRRQPAGHPGRGPRHRLLGEGGPVRADLRRLQHPARHLRRRARASCPGPTRSTGGSSATGPSCSTPTASRRCRGSRSSPARATAARTSS